MTTLEEGGPDGTLSREAGSPSHYRTSAPSHSRKAGSIRGVSTSFSPHKQPETGGPGPAECRSWTAVSPSPFTQATRTSCTAPGPAPCQAWGAASTVLQMTLPTAGVGRLALVQATSPQMLSSPPIPRQRECKGVQCHRGAQKADEQMETSNCAAPSPMDSPAPLPCGPGQRTCQWCPRPPAACLPPRPGRARRCPAGSRDWGSRLRAAAVSPRHPALGSSPPSATRVPKTAPAAHAPAPRRPRPAEPWAHARPACPWPRPEGTARRRGDRGWAAAAYLGPGQRSSRATLAPQSGPEQRAAGAGGSCSAPGHPPTRRRLRAAPAAGRSAPSAAGAGERERASAAGVAEPAQTRREAGAGGGAVAPGAGGRRGREGGRRAGRGEGSAGRGARRGGGLAGKQSGVGVGVGEGGAGRERARLSCLKV